MVCPGRSTKTTRAEPWSRQPHSLVPLRREGSGRPLFLIHGLGGLCGRAGALGTWPGRGLPGVWASGPGAGCGPGGPRFDRSHGRVLLARDTGGATHGAVPVRGLVDGGDVALEAARQLGGSGRRGRRCWRCSTPIFRWPTSRSWIWMTSQCYDGLLRDLKLSAAELRKLPLERQWERIEEQAMRAEGIGVAEIRRLAAVCKAHLAALAATCRSLIRGSGRAVHGRPRAGESGGRVESRCAPGSASSRFPAITTQCCASRTWNCWPNASAATSRKSGGRRNDEERMRLILFLLARPGGPCCWPDWWAW